MKKILIIYSGGTIGMVHTEKGYVPRPGWLKGELETIADLYNPAMPAWDFLELDPILDSSNISVPEWNGMAEIIAQNYDTYDGFVIMHGTDTMAYTASALAFMLENLDKPVILTGSQIPLCEMRSDGRENLITSLLIASDERIREVCLCFGSKLLRGNRATKYSIDGLDAFTSPNYPPLAEIGIKIRLNENALLPERQGTFHLQKLASYPVGVIKVVPGMSAALLERIITEDLCGFVLETFGAGNIPERGSSLVPVLLRAAQSGAVITVCSQCPEGTVTLGVYETSTGLMAAGAVSGYDLTTEAAITKMYYLFSKGLDRDTIRTEMTRNICGEMTVSVR